MGDNYVFVLWFLPSFFFLSFFPRLISAVADLMSTILAHMVWPYCANLDAGLKPAACRSLEMQNPKNRQKLAIWAPWHKCVGVYLRN